jgi:riboflavin synthase
MFTGLISHTGSIASLDGHRIAINAPAELAARLQEGDSVAVNGVCLTALSISPSGFHADLSAETLARTTLSALQKNSVVNLELPTPAGDPLGGHVVQGHVDGVATLISLERVAAASDDWLLRVRIPAALAQFVVEKGSITLDGISLTVANLARRDDGDVEISVAVIPHTYAVTNLHKLTAGAPMNVEVDVLAKYAALRSDNSQQISLAYLIANGY